MNDSPTLNVVPDDFDDICSCDSVYHSLLNTPVQESSPLAPSLGLAAPVPESKAPSTPGLDFGAMKDQRSHERARQRLKKPDDIRRGKRCVRCKMCKPQKWAGNAGRPKRNLHTPSDAEDECKLELGDGEADERAIAPPASRTVSLADLVTPPRKRSDKQFEIVGRPRQVLVMDEFTEVDSKFDFHDWEYVETEAKHRNAGVHRAPTYATVVARA